MYCCSLRCALSSEWEDGMIKTFKVTEITHNSCIRFNYISIANLFLKNEVLKAFIPNLFLPLSLMKVYIHPYYQPATYYIGIDLQTAGKNYKWWKIFQHLWTLFPLLKYLHLSTKMLISIKLCEYNNSCNFRSEKELGLNLINVPIIQR